MLFSGVVHFGALIAMGLWTAASSDDWGGVRLMINVGRGEAVPAIDDSPLEDTVQLEVADDAAAMGPVELFEDVALPAAEVPGIDVLAATATEVSGLDGLALGGKGEGEGSTSRAATEFFGIGGYGQSFVYVVDCSGSMTERGKFERARYELMQSIEQLYSNQRFFIIFFNDGAYPMDADEMVFATEEQVERTAEWVAYVEAGGGTNPLPALLFAISLHPDAVYFLSDGQFETGAIRQLRWRNRPNRRLHIRQVPIHTIAFMDRATEYLMRTIAHDSGGEYRFVK
jgi:Mg-chelatase subunit ChlD